MEPAEEPDPAEELERSLHRGGPYVCLVCRRGLEHEVNVATDPATGLTVVVQEQWVHNGAQHADHAAVVAKGLGFDDQVSVCDFCGELHPAWDFPCETFSSPLPSNGGMTRSYGSVEGWFACDGCTKLIVASTPDSIDELFDALWRRWTANYDQELRGYHPRHRRELRRYVEQMWTGFLLNRKGAPVPVLTGELPPEP